MYTVQVGEEAHNHHPVGVGHHDDHDQMVVRTDRLEEGIPLPPNRC